MKTRLMVLLLLGATLSAQEVPFKLFCVSDLEKVFPDGYQVPASSSTIDLFGIRDEIVSAQCVVLANSDLKRVSVATENLVSDGGKSIIPDGAIQCNFVEGIPLTKNSEITAGKSLLRKAPALFPDYLSRETSKSIAKGAYQAIWLTLHIPSDASAGTYTGKVTISSDRGSQSLPVRVQVYPIEMPRISHLYTTNWYSISSKYHDFGKEYDDKFFELVEAYARNMSEHRQNVFRVDLTTISASMGDSKKPDFDFSSFDRWVKIFERTGTMTRLETGFVATFAEDWWSTKIVLRDFNVFDKASGRVVKMKGEEYLPQFLPAFEKHLKDIGWLDKTVFHIADEPSNSNIISWREASAYVHKYAPSLKRIEALEGTFFDDRLEVWVPKLDHLTNMWNTFKKAQREGCELWYYMAMTTNAYPNRFIDSPLIETRILHWLNYRFGITGYLHYGFNSWVGKDPYVDMDEPQYGVGANAIVYPLKDGILNSIRWEEERNGLSDYEYLWLLEQETAQLKREIAPYGSWIKPEQRGVELASQVIASTTQFSRDPNVLYATKKEILNEIFDFQTHPRLYVQTTPQANSTLVYGQILIEITGWTEPGSKVLMNGKNVVVSDGGEFRTVVALTPDITTIKVTTRNGSLSRTVERQFRVDYPTK
jgi:hypothetical protein